MRYQWFETGVLLAGLSVGVAGVQAAPPPPSAQIAAPGGEYITREQFEQAQKAWQDKLDNLQTQLTQVKTSKEDVAAREKERQEEMADLEKMIKDNQLKVDALHPGLRALVIAGDASVSFTSQKTSNSSFGATFSPVFLYRLDDAILFEGAFDVGVGNTDVNTDGSTTFDLSIADATYAVCDNLVVGGGVFVTPFGVYHNHYDPSWINKLPSDPLAFGDGGIAPGSSLGLFARGAVPVSDSKFTYDVYVINGPRVVTNSSTSDGTLLFKGYDDNNNGKSVGGRIGFLPVPWLEVGYSVLAGTVTPTGMNRAAALLQAVDCEVKRDVDCLSGTIDFRTEVVWSHVDSINYPRSTDGLFGPATFAVDRNGGYVQLAYRPNIGNKIVDKIEGVARFDWLLSPLSVPGGEHEQSWTLGVDYWVRSNVVLKVAYQFDHRVANASLDAFLMQLGMGF